MTRKSKREIERDLEDIETTSTGRPERRRPVLYKDPDTGELRTSDGDVVDEEGADPIVIIEREVVSSESEVADDPE